MIATKEQQKFIDELLEKEGIYHTIGLDFDVETWTEKGCTSVYIDGDVSFDILAEIIDHLRACNPKEK